MRKVMLAGKQSDTLNALSEALSASYSLQTCGFEPEVIYEVIDTFAPEIIVISLEGAHESVKSVLRRINTKYSDIPVLTLGTSYEKAAFAQYYKESQFTNLERPADKEKVIAAIDRRLADSSPVSSDSKRYILLVDDDMTLLRWAKKVLEDKYEVNVAQSGAAAMKIIERRLPDLVLLDYEMPNVNGREMLEQLRANDATKDMPVVFLTGFSDREHIDAILGLNPQGYLVKPADPVKLKEAVERVIYYL